MSIRTYANFDDVLGPADQRFFGSGYRRIDHEIHHLHVDRAITVGAATSALATATYPHDWSVKSGGDVIQPHLSSIDAVVLAASLAEVHVRIAHDLDDEQHGRSWLTALDVRAGSKPQTQLAGVPVTARLADATARAEQGELDSTYDCQIGTLAVRCTFRHPDPGRPPAPTSSALFSQLEDALGPWEQRVYGGAHQRSRQTFHHVAVDDEAPAASCQVRIAYDADPSNVIGAESAHAPSVSAVDTIVSMAHLIQATLYSLDDVGRGDSDTLWMRRLRLTATTPHRPVGSAFATSIEIPTTRVLDRNAMGRWRTADIVAADFAGFSFGASVAHRLPAASLLEEASA